MTESDPEVVLHHAGEMYRWTERGGFVDEQWLKPPAGVIRELQSLLAEKLRERDSSISDPVELVRKASLAREENHLSRAAELARRALELDPELPGAAAVLSSVLRALRRPTEALEVTAPFEKQSHVPILTTRAAAFLDVGDCEAARRIAKRAWAIAQGSKFGSAELSLVFKRLEKECSS